MILGECTVGISIMINNDVLRRLRYALQINDTGATLFALAGHDGKRYLHAIMKREEEPGYLLSRQIRLIP